MIFRYTDPLGDALFIAPASNEDGPVVSFRGVMRGSGEITVIHVPLDRLEEVIAGIHEAAHQSIQAASPVPVPPSVPPGRTPGRSS